MPRGDRGGKCRGTGERCVAANCGNTRAEGVSMFRFRAVKEIDRYETWADFVRTKRKGWIPTKHSVLCSAHFEEKWLSFRHLFEQDHMPRKRKYCKLHEDAFPTIHAKSPDPPAAEKGMSEKGQDCLLHAAPSKQLVAKSARPGQEKLQRGKEKSDHRGTAQTKIRRSNTRKKSDRVR
ncbi:hypothetical protein FSP39_018135 [Pinctada imbricata]|uniref:THAP-type domain-containing protein n=1 Tax=Pinctada imbricata TaxID=66713 RepID=A0AA88XRY2_PINIB|nr:hypothetical protein FSP39_018135 [Pinctada imbricata]